MINNNILVVAIVSIPRSPCADLLECQPPLEGLPSPSRLSSKDCFLSSPHWTSSQILMLFA